VNAPANRSEALITQYEQLRRDALSQQSECVAGLGLALFLRQGMVAWMRGCADYVYRLEAQPPPSFTPSAPLPLEVRAQLAVILAGMIAEPLRSASHER
jgi:hypothetical protein